MSYCCSQCSFTAHFESALIMHHQLHHEASAVDGFPELGLPKLKDKSSTLPRASSPSFPLLTNKNRGLKLPCRTSSATRLLGKLKARICKSRTLFGHPEEIPESTTNVNNLSANSDCTSNAMKDDSMVFRTSAIATCLEDHKETYSCHLCHFDADRITVLDRHLLNVHKLDLESLLKLVMSKTKDGLIDECNSNKYGIRQPYYKPQNEIIEEGEFIIETVTPTIKILKHASTNTDRGSSHKDFGLEKNFQMISKEIENLLSCEQKCDDNDDFMVKMQTLNDYMCKFVNSSNTLKKVLTKELDGKITGKDHLNGDSFCNLGLGDRETPRNWERAHSEKMERDRNKYGESCRSDKPKASAESFYF